MIDALYAYIDDLHKAADAVECAIAAKKDGDTKAFEQHFTRWLERFVAINNYHRQPLHVADLRESFDKYGSD